MQPDITPPILSNIIIPTNITKHTPYITISVNSEDDGVGTANITLYYSLGQNISGHYNWTNYKTLPMSLVSGTIYNGVYNIIIDNNTIDYHKYKGYNLSYYIRGTDNNGNTNITGNYSNYIIPVHDPPTIIIYQPNNMSNREWYKKY